jgi:hypothetical protein
MYSAIDSTKLKRPGDYVLSDVILTSYRSESGNNTNFKISVKTLVSEINLYESINNKTLSGNIVLIDAQNVVAALPLTGFERIEFKMFTPSISRGFDFTDKTGHPMYIYRIGNRQGVNPRTQIYTLFFTSKEMVRNEKVRVKKAYTGQISNAVTDILRDPDILDTEKNIFVEETLGLHRYIGTTEKPFDFIDTLSKSARSRKYHNPGMYFYETSYGFNFRSVESMLAITDNQARPVVARFEPKPMNIRVNGNRDIIREMKVASHFEIKDQFNTLKNLRNGIYAATTTEYDSFYKTHKDLVFDYHKDYELANHTEHNKNGGKVDDKSIAPIINEGGKMISDYKEGTQYVVPVTSFLHGVIPNAPMAEILPRRLSSRLAFESFKLELTVPGFTGVSAGELIAFDMPSYAPVNTTNPMDHDPYMSGRYLIGAIRHHISSRTNKHTMVLECIKDSVRYGYPEENIDTFTGKEKADRGVIDQYTLDDTLLTGGNSDIFI